MTSEDLAKRVLYRDALMLVIDKPAGVPVHEGPRNARERNARVSGEPMAAPLTSMFEALRYGLPRRPELAHRLDRDTSGCLVLGRNRAALAKLGEMFASGVVGKTYWAVVAGGPGTDEGVIDLPLGRRDKSRGWWMKVDPQGQPALTRWRVMGRGAMEPDPKKWAPMLGEDQAPTDNLAPGGKALTALALEPVTGRTHQLRVHCAAMGWSILGDPIYGEAERLGAPTLHLHSRCVEVPLYEKRAPIKVEAPVPAHMRAALEACGLAPAVPGE